MSWYVNVTGDSPCPIGHNEDCCVNYSAPTKDAAIAIAAEVWRETPDHLLVPAKQPTRV